MLATFPPVRLFPMRAAIIPLSLRSYSSSYRGLGLGGGGDDGDLPDVPLIHHAPFYAVAGSSVPWVVKLA